MNIKQFKKDLKDNAEFIISNRYDELDVKSYLPEKKSFAFRLRLVNVFAGFLVLSFISLFSYLSLNPVTTLTIDINPEIELKLNVFNRVIAVNGMNDDANEFITGLDVKYKSIEKATELIYEHGLETEYDYNGNLYVLYGVYSTKENLNEKITDKINASVLSFVKTIVITDVLDTPNDLEYNIELTPSFSYDDIPEDSTSNTPATEQKSYSSIVEEYQGSDTLLNLVILIFNESEEFTTSEDFTYLLSLELYELYDLYNK